MKAGEVGFPDQADLTLRDSAVPRCNTCSEVWRMDWGCCIQAGRWAPQHKVNVEAIKPETWAGLDPITILDREATLWRVALVTT